MGDRRLAISGRLSRTARVQVDCAIWKLRLRGSVLSSAASASRVSGMRVLRMAAASGLKRSVVACEPFTPQRLLGVGVVSGALGVSVSKVMPAGSAAASRRKSASVGAVR